METEIALIGQNIKKLRELKNLSREEFAARIGLSPSGYSKIERGEVDLTIYRLGKIAMALEVSLS